MRLSPGDTFPAWELVSDSGETLSSSQMEGTRYVMYFYSKDSTPGCTAEAVEFTSLLPKFRLRNITVFGVSGDSTESHVRFRDANGLKVILLTDPGKEFAKKVGAFGEKTNYGRTVTGTIRSTFVVGRDGKVEAAQYNVKAKGHAQRILDIALSNFRSDRSQTLLEARTVEPPVDDRPLGRLLRGERQPVHVDGRYLREPPDAEPFAAERERHVPLGPGETVASDRPGLHQTGQAPGELQARGGVREHDLGRTRADRHRRYLGRISLGMEHAELGGVHLVKRPDAQAVYLGAEGPELRMSE